LAGQEDLDAWRTAAGISRFGVDALPGDLPQEAGFEEAVSFDKGCFLGQEAVAKVRNLGHPRRVVVHLTAEAEVSAGEDVESGSTKVGEVTSVATVDGHQWLLARVRWEDRERPLRTAAGVTLVPVPRA
jgi:folate-binding protein YgfZ